MGAPRSSRVRPRERCIRAIEHEAPDRVPLDFSCRPEPLAELLRATGLGDAERLLRALGVDVRRTGPALRGGSARDRRVAAGGGRGPQRSATYPRPGRTPGGCWRARTAAFRACADVLPEYRMALDDVDRMLRELEELRSGLEGALGF